MVVVVWILVLMLMMMTTKTLSLHETITTLKESLVRTTEITWIIHPRSTTLTGRATKIDKLTAIC